MASSEKQSMTEELLEAIKEKMYDTCVSNLTKTHCVNLKKFKRERLPEGTWINTKRFVNNSNRPVADTMFSLFGEFSNQDGSEVRDTMIGWSYDNFRLLEQVFKVALDQQKTTLRVWLEKMANKHTPGDELTLYILARMYRRHVYVYTEMFWWTTLLYTLPVTEQELLSQCEIVLVYVKDRVYSELDQIRGPVTKSAQAADTNAPPEADSSHETVKISNVMTPANVSQKTNPDITGSTNIEVMKDFEEIVTTESAGKIQVATDDSTIRKDPLVAESSKTGNVITENTRPGEDIMPKLPNVEDTGRPNASLPGIGVFLNKTCTIPLIRCDFKTIKTAVESREEPADSNNPPPSGDPGSPTLRTSSRKRTVIDYKKIPGGVCRPASIASKKKTGS